MMEHENWNLLYSRTSQVCYNCIRKLGPPCRNKMCKRAEYYRKENEINFLFDEKELENINGKL